MKPLQPLLTVSAPPHVHCGRTIRGYMAAHILALAPAAVMAVAVFGVGALRVMALAVAASVIVEALCGKVMKVESKVDDFSAVYTGLLLAFLLPASAPWWLVVMGSTVSIVLGKMIFGGLGGNPLCSPLVGWAACRISWPTIMDTDASMLMSTLPAPLHQLKFFGLQAVQNTDYLSLALGNQLGGLGAVQVLALLAGGVFLLIRGYIRLETPLAFLAGLLATAWVYQAIDPAANPSPLFHLLAGGTVFGAFFLATDSSSSPIGLIPSILFGLTTGAMVVIIRVYGVYPDGVPFAVLLTNLFTPLFDRIRPKPFGAAMLKGGR